MLSCECLTFFGKGERPSLRIYYRLVTCRLLPFVDAARDDIDARVLIRDDFIEVICQHCDGFGRIMSRGFRESRASVSKIIEPRRGRKRVRESISLRVLAISG